VCVCVWCVCGVCVCVWCVCGVCVCVCVCGVCVCVCVVFFARPRELGAEKEEEDLRRVSIEGYLRRNGR